MEVSILKSIISKNLIELFEETPQNNFKIVQKYLRSKRKKRLIAVNEIINKKVGRRVPKCKEFTKTIGEMPDDIFYSHFRMRTSTFKKLYCMLQPLWKIAKTGRPCITLKNALYITLETRKSK